MSAAAPRNAEIAVCSSTKPGKAFPHDELIGSLHRCVKVAGHVVRGDREHKCDCFGDAGPFWKNDDAEAHA